MFLIKTIIHVNLKMLKNNKIFKYYNNQLLTNIFQMFKIFRFKNQKAIHLRYQS